MSYIEPPGLPTTILITNQPINQSLISYATHESHTHHLGLLHVAHSPAMQGVQSYQSLLTTAWVAYQQQQQQLLSPQPPRFGRDQLAWALTMVQSRSMRMGGGAGSVARMRVMLPALDMLNHAAHGAVCSGSLALGRSMAAGREGDTVHFVARRALRKGEQVRCRGMGFRAWGYRVQGAE